MPSPSADDFRHMRNALVLAARGLGRTAPNPLVGCVIVSMDGFIAGRGWTGVGGRPHAETIALAQAGEAARGATVYVTLEPCAHHGKTPPCANALIAAAVSRVVVAVGDPDPRVNGQGLAMLREAGIAVATNILEDEATRLNQGFFLRVRENRPLVTLKVAQSQDGFTATAPGTDKWITGVAARRYAHLLRAKHDAILVGIGTVLADDPELTCRLPGLEDRSPLRVVLDSDLRLPLQSKLVKMAREFPTLVFTASDGGEHLRAAGVEIARVAPGSNGHPDIKAVLNALAAGGITRLLVEGGATVHAAFLSAGLVDRLEIFTAPTLLGKNGRNPFAALTRVALAESPNFVRLNARRFGPDFLETFAANP